MLEVLRMRLEDWGFRVETADSGKVNWQLSLAVRPSRFPLPRHFATWQGTPS